MLVHEYIKLRKDVREHNSAADKLKIKGGITMGRVSEAMTRFMLNEKFLQRFEEKVVKGEAATVDVFLKKNMEYVVRGKVLKGRGTPVLSIRGIAGSAVPAQYRDHEKSFSVIPEKDGLYRIGVEAGTEADEREPVTLAVTFSYYIPSPKYTMGSIETLPSELSWYMVVGDGPEKRSRETNAAAAMEGSGTMVYNEMLEDRKTG
jgi:hypothetical protein